MADSSQALLAELDAELTVIVPQIAGLQGLAVIPGSSPSLVTELNEQVADRQRRQGLNRAAHDAITALQADGYPNLPPVAIPDSLLSELQEEQAAIAAAIGMFTEQGQITAGTMTLTPNPKPPTSPGP